MRRICILALCAACLAPAALAQQQDFSKVQIKAEKLSATTYMLTGAGGNLGLSVGADAVFLVDDQFAPLTARIKAEIAKLTKKPVRFVINTHWHFDHTGGNENLGKAGALIVAHENVRKRMPTEQFMEFLDMKTKPDPPAALPVVTFTRDGTFYLNGDEIHVLHVPNAHTDGDAIVHFRNSDAAPGRHLFQPALSVHRYVERGHDRRHDRRGRPGARARGREDEDHPRSRSARDEIRSEGVSRHACPVGGRIKEAKQAGRTMQEVVAAKPTADFDDVFGKGFLPPARFVEMVWKNLAK